MSGSTEFILILLCLVGSGLFSGLETGVISVNRLRLEHLVRQKVKKAEIILDFINRPDHLLGTTLVGTNICNVALSVLGTSFLVRLLGDNGDWAAAILITLIVLVFGEYLPKAWFQSRPARRSMRFARVLQFFGVLLHPISATVSKLAALLIPAPNQNGQENAHLLSREEMYRLFTQDSADAYLTEQKKHMIHRVFSLANKTCKDIMIPRDQTVIIEQHTPLPDIVKRTRTQPLNRVPIYSEEAGRFVGILNILDVIEQMDNPDARISTLMRLPHYISEDTPADDLIPRMRQARQPLMLVRNEQSEVTGIITTEVVLAEIVGHSL